MLNDIPRKWSAFGFISENSKEIKKNSVFFPFQHAQLRAILLGREGLKEQTIR